MEPGSHYTKELRQRCHTFYPQTGPTVGVCISSSAYKNCNLLRQEQMTQDVGITSIQTENVYILFSPRAATSAADRLPWTQMVLR